MEQPKKRVRPPGMAGSPPASKPNGKPAAKPAAKKPRLSRLDQVKQAWTDPEDVRKNLSKGLDAIEQRIVASGDELSTYTVAGAHKLIAGIPLPSLAAEYLFDNNVWPLGRFSQILGTEGSYKSFFCAEISRWFIESSGAAWLGEHESKFSPDLVASTIGWGRQNFYRVTPCESMDHWQSAIQDYARSHKRMMMGTKAEPGPGAVWPLLLLVDSIMGKSLEGTQDKIEAAGAATGGHPREAKSLTIFMRFFPQRISRWPFHFIMVNHLRPKKVEGQYTLERDRAGGRGKEFQESFEIDMEKVGRIEQAGLDGAKLKITVHKNSLGDTGRSIRVNVRWWQEDDPENDGGWRQITKFDWDEATVELLAGDDRSGSLPSHEKTKVKEVVDLAIIGNPGTQRTAWSKKLGISKDSPLPVSDVGRIIREDAVIMHQLRRALGIHMRKVFVPGTDYLSQLLGIKMDIAKQHQLYKWGQKKKAGGGGGDE